jgi:anti-anti-sigma factor
MPQLRIRVDDDRVVWLAGEFDLLAEEPFAAATSRLDRDPDDVVVDLTDVSFIDSTGVRCLLRLARSVEPSRVVLRRPSAAVARLLDIVRIEGTLGIHVVGEEPD